MDSVHGDTGLPCRVSPFRHPRIIAYLLLPAAFRSLSRLSSALSAKASALRPYLLEQRDFLIEQECSLARARAASGVCRKSSLRSLAHKKEMSLMTRFSFDIFDLLYSVVKGQ